MALTEKEYTKQEIDQISATKKAVEGKLYKMSTGEYFVGTSLGTLIYAQRADVVPAATIDGIESTDVQGVLKELSTRQQVIEGDYVTEEELAAAELRARCFSLSMSMIL